MRVEDNASLVDVLPTVCELAGAPIPAGIEGRSLAPLVGRSTARGGVLDRPLFAHRKAKEASGDLWSVVAGDWKLIERGDGVRELYDLRDRAEHDNLAAKHPEVVAKLAAELAAFRVRAKPLSSERIDVELDARALENLRQLGYTK